MKAGEVVFQKLLDGKIQYVVPLYQRTYNWEERQWDQLWDDLMEVYSLPEPRNHFIGSIVTQQVPNSPQTVDRYTLIDGQQRMTTLLILLSLIRKRAELDGKTWDHLAEEIKETSLSNKFSPGEERLKLLPTQRDRKAFEDAVDGAVSTANSQIDRARDYFDRMLNAGDSEGNEIDLRRLHSRIVNNLDMVSIHLEQDDSPNRIFESLNNTGLRLSVADLIRNYLLMNIPDIVQQEDAYNKHWRPIEQRLEDNSSDIAADFFWRYQMMDGSLLRKDETYKSVQDSLGGLTPGKALVALEQFDKFSVYYSQVSGLNSVNLSKELAEGIDRLNRWEVTVAYPFLMRAMDFVNSGGVSQTDLIEAIRLIESYVIRRTVCGVPTNQLRRIFAQLSSQVDFDGQFLDSTRKQLMNNRWPNDADFRSEFVKFPLYSSSRVRGGRLNLVLWTLERAFGNKETPDQSDSITIEHIMPQDLTDEWREELGPEASDIHEKWLHTIGNLTLTGYNPSLSNKPFSEKRVILSDSNFALSSTINDFSEWNDVSIQARGNELANLALGIWTR